MRPPLWSGELKLTEEEAQRALFMARAILLGDLVSPEKAWAVGKTTKTYYEMAMYERTGVWPSEVSGEVQP